MSGWTIGWLLWLGWFAIEEAAAIINKKRGDTLSEHVWKWFAVDRPITNMWLATRRVALAAFMILLTFHFLTGQLK